MSLGTAPIRPLVPGALGALAAAMYGAAVRRRNARFDAGAGVERFGVPVVSVGNLSVGGTGKTPMVMHVARLLVEMGRRPCIAMRGYQGGTASDEASEYAAELPGVPVVAQADRAAGLRPLLGERPEIDCIVLDDGFQHRQIARDLDIVLLDATRDPFADRLLPAGWLREPVGSLARADMVVVTHAEATAPGATDQIVRRVLAVNPRLSVGACRHQWTALRARRGDSEDQLPPEWLFKRAVVVCCAIGNPGAFVAEATRRIGGPPAGVLVRRDHDPFSERTVRALIGAARDARAEAILVTEKDWAKLRRVEPGRWPCPVVRPRLALRFERGGEALVEAVARAVGAGMTQAG